MTIRNICRCALMIDIAHLKGVFKGTMLFVVVMYENNQIMHVSYGLSNSECTKSWSWFVQKLHECIRGMKPLTLISGRAPSIATTIENISLYVYHGVCGNHLLPNIVVRFKRNVANKTLFWKATKAYKVEYIEYYMEALCLKKPT